MKTFPTTAVELVDPILDGFVGRKLKLYTTLEGENPGGSVKDHMVFGSLTKLLAEGALKRGTVITEASAGSTALSLAYYTHLLDVKCTLFVPETHPVEAQALLRKLGAEVRLVDLSSNWKAYYDFCEQPGVLPFNQHLDAAKRVFYRELGRRIVDKTGPLDAIVGAIGTTHSLVGVSEGMENEDLFTAAAEPLTEKVSGIRNMDTVRYGETDPCTPDLFDERILLEKAEFFQSDTLLTRQGPIQFSDSFRVALGGLARLARSRPKMNSCFVLGSTNRR
jgi:cysteine synthase